MLIQLISSKFDSNVLITILFLIPIAMFSLSFHEFAHGWVAYKCGDSTARNFGRLTMNPVKHLDPIGSLMILLIGFGWAKPVPINPRNFRKPKRDIGLVSLAGPLSNFILALVFTFAYHLAITIILKANIYSRTSLLIYEFFYLAVIINIGLGLFNLIPIQPLDGSKILASLLPPKSAMKYMQLENYSRYFMLFLILATYIPFPVWNFTYLSDIIFTPLNMAREQIFYAFSWLVSKLPWIL